LNLNLGATLNPMSIMSQEGNGKQKELQSKGVEIENR
jgi:hypothetical protein